MGASVAVGLEVKVGVIVWEGVAVGGSGVGGTGEGIMVKVGEGVTVGVWVGKAICAPKVAPAPLIPIKTTIPNNRTTAPTVYPNKVSGRKPSKMKVRAAINTAPDKYWAKTTSPSGKRNGSPLPSPRPAADNGRYKPYAKATLGSAALFSDRTIDAAVNPAPKATNMNIAQDNWELAIA